MMLAEQDRDAYRRNVAAVAREKEIMKDVPGWEVSFFSFEGFGGWRRAGGFGEGECGPS